MGNITPPIDPDQRPEEHIYLSRIEKDKIQKEDEMHSSTEAKPVVVNAFLLYLKKVMSLFSPAIVGENGSVDKTQLLHDLVAFKTLFELLAKSDESHNPLFTSQLSEVWLRLTSHFKNVQPAPHLMGWALKLSLFIRKLQSYPPNENFSLGYYLSEYVGKEWLPFPFMDILEQLHKNNASQRQLTLWIADLASIIDHLENP